MRVSNVRSFVRSFGRFFFLLPFLFLFDGLTFGENNVHTTHARARPFVTFKHRVAVTVAVGWLRRADSAADHPCAMPRKRTSYKYDEEVGEGTN